MNHVSIYINLFSALFSANALRRLRIDHGIGNAQSKPYETTPAVWKDLMLKPADAKLPRFIWSNWEQGHWQASAPELNRVCLEQWSALNPGWEHKVLDSQNVSELFPDLHKLFQEHPGTVNHRSDMLRLWLLAEYGGVWADSSLLPVKPLDSFVEKSVAPSGFFTFRFPKVEGRVTSWFLAALPKNDLVLQWKQAFVERWKTKDHMAYFEVHRTLVDLVKQQHPSVMAVFNKMPLVGQQWPHACIEGCDNYWDVMKYEDVPPMLKRPYQKSADHTVPKEWLQKYKQFVANKGLSTNAASQ